MHRCPRLARQCRRPMTRCRTRFGVGPVRRASLRSLTGLDRAALCAGTRRHTLPLAARSTEAVGVERRPSQPSPYRTDCSLWDAYAKAACESTADHHAIASRRQWPVRDRASPPADLNPHAQRVLRRWTLETIRCMFEAAARSRGAIALSRATSDRGTLR